MDIARHGHAVKTAAQKNYIYSLVVDLTTKHIVNIANINMTPTPKENRKNKHC